MSADHYLSGKMMLPTHALAGLLLAIPVALTVPEFASVALLAGVLGGIFPDLDLYTGHRKTLHFPVYYAVTAAVTAVLVVSVPTTVTVALALFFLAAAAHCIMDIFGGGLELRPWAASSEKAVYSHYHGRWLAPRRWIRYDGSPADLLLAIVLGVPSLVLLSGWVRWLVGGLLTVAITYVVLRKRLATLAQRVASLAPRSLQSYVPERYLEP